jgi:DNA-binding transcriptional ArsR family regulator
MDVLKIDTLSGLLKSISHPMRLKILCLLQDGEMAVGDLRSELKTSNANISQHLTILRNQGVVVTRRDATYIYNRIADGRVVELIDTLQKLYC